MEQIAAGKGRGPKPFMAAGAKASDPERHLALEPAKEPKTKRAGRGNAASAQRPRAKRAKQRPRAMPRFIAPQLCKTLSRPPQGDDWVHEIKFDGYRMQLRIRGWRCHPAHAQRPRLDRQVPGRRQGRRAFARCDHRRRGRRPR